MLDNAAVEVPFEFGSDTIILPISLLRIFTSHNDKLPYSLVNKDTDLDMCVLFSVYHI